MGDPPHTDGIDVSYWQQTIDWSQVATTGIWWGATRIWDRQHAEAGGAGSGADVTFARNRAGMASAGLRYRLLYHFLEDRSVADQAAQCWWTMQGHLDLGEGVMLDAESNCTEEQAYTWIGLMEGYTQRPVVVYTNRNVDGGRIWDSTRIFDGTRARIYPDYRDFPEQTDAQWFLKASQRAAPQGWDVWQHSSTGRIPGIAGNVDLDQVDDWEIFDVACGYA